MPDKENARRRRPLRHATPFEAYDVPALLAERARLRADHPFLIWAPLHGDGETWTYARFADAVARLAGGLAARGVKPGDRVLVHLENCPETLFIRFACAWAGAVAVMSNAMATGPELAHLASSSGAIAAVTQPKFAATLAAHCPGLKWVAVTATDAGEAPASPPAGGDSYAALLHEPLPRRMPDPSVPASIMFTTGTTGRPKGVVWTHANTLWGARLGALQQQIRADDVVQVFLPLFHVVGFSWTFLPALWAGATVVLQPRFSGSRFWPTALAYRATITTQVLFTSTVLARQEVPQHTFRQWTVARHDPAQQTLFRVPCLAAWGMTEMVGQPIVGDPNVEPRPLSVGRPSPAYGIRIVDDEGRPSKLGEPGHLLVDGVRGLSIFAGYDGDEAATAAAFDESGSFRTGDRVILHEDGWIQFGDRVKDIIKVGGEGVSAAEIEAVIARTPGIRDVAVVAKPDPLYGEVPVAFVILGEGAGAQTTTAAALERCRTELAKFKVPRDIIVKNDFPRVGFGKVAKAQLRDTLR